MANHRIQIIADGRTVETLEDILPSAPGLKILFVAKTPTPISVEAGHYFQGKQGTMFWNKLTDYRILKVPNGEYHDDHLLGNGYGLTDIVKVPRGFGNEPSDDEYLQGMKRIIDLIKLHQPMIVVFVYKKVLDNILRLGFGRRNKSVYGFNPSLDHSFGCRVFAFPIPGTGGCTTTLIHKAMTELAAATAIERR